MQSIKIKIYFLLLLPDIQKYLNTYLYLFNYERVPLDQDFGALKLSHKIFYIN